ncbi:LysR family transcriptional regulator [Nocardia goodfellowii]|uniref:DNA-binding transcriptional LysR family regulator n=1 Tax=Nocardia goodfellowii TaxID=882446 RepID=A0ABS4QH31_9NOCA|nr:LysR family transcriptional regulator [Nocardia goodfellowii]MBP2190992.1 DNA-binding transcriptional LysR family regulator [Nocardia goodfellowii]
MERYEIETFLTLAEELHFARTAERLRISPGRVSQTIKQLERRLGSSLFVRTSRQVTLTEVGQRFRDELLPGCRQIQRAIRNASDAARRVEGPVRVAFSGPWSGKLVVQAADAFRAQYPDCEVLIREMSLVDSYGPIRAGEVQVQLSEYPCDEPDMAVGPVLFSEPPALLVPAEHPLAQQDSASPEDFARAPLITFSGLSQSFRDLHYPHRTPLGAVVHHLPVKMHFPEALCFIGEGKGMTVVARAAQDYHTRHDVAYLPLTEAPPFEYALLWPAERETAAVRAFVDTVHRIARREPQRLRIS